MTNNLIDPADLVDILSDLDSHDVTEERLADEMEKLAPANVLYLPGLDKWEPSKADVKMIKSVDSIIKEYELSEASLRGHLRKMFRVNNLVDDDTNDEYDAYDKDDLYVR